MLVAGGILTGASSISFIVGFVASLNDDDRPAAVAVMTAAFVLMVVGLGLLAPSFIV